MGKTSLSRMQATLLFPTTIILCNASYSAGSQARNSCWFLADGVRYPTNLPSLLSLSSGTKNQTTPRVKGIPLSASPLKQKAFRSPYFPKSPRSPTYRFCKPHFPHRENFPQMGRGRNRHIINRFSVTETLVTTDKAIIHGSHLASRLPALSNSDEAATSPTTAVTRARITNIMPRAE